METLLGDYFRWLVCIFLLLAGGCATLPANVERDETTAFTDTHDTSLGRQVQQTHSEQDGKSGFLLLGNGLDAFVARAVLAQKAERSIDAQYYLLHNDVVGRLFIDQLYKAAERGVRVRLLVDDIDMEGLDFKGAVLDSHPNFQVRVFNPFSRNVGRTGQYISGFGRQTRRAHNKSFTVDNQATILGGRNIGDEYFAADPDLDFLDLDVLAVGPAALQVSASFDQYWNHDLSYPISVLVRKQPSAEEISRKKREFDQFVSQLSDSLYIQHLRNSDLVNRLQSDRLDFFWADGTVVADDPDKLTVNTNEKKYRMSEKLAPYMVGIERELIIFSPYFVPGNGGIALFRQLRDDGVQIKILTNSLASTDVGIVHAGYARYRKVLLRMGVELFELNGDINYKARATEKDNNGAVPKSSLHAKCFVLDRQKVFIGSLNLDPRSIVQNTEIGLIFDSEPIARFLAEEFDQQIDSHAFRLDLIENTNGTEKIIWYGVVDGERVTFDHDPHTGFWKRFGIGFMGLLPIESQI